MKRRTWIAGLVILLVFCVIGLAWRKRLSPERPRNVTSDAVFISVNRRASHTPNSRSGDWLNCWHDTENDANRCRLSDVNGKLEYEGAFLPYQASGPVPASRSRIDFAARGTRIQWLHFGPRFLPTIRLRDGTILVPMQAYEGDPRIEDE